MLPLHIRAVLHIFVRYPIPGRASHAQLHLTGRFTATDSGTDLISDLGGGDVHLGSSAGSLLGRGLGHLILELAVLQLEPVERRHRHVVVPVRVMEVRYFGFTFALVAMLLNAWQDFMGLILLL